METLTVFAILMVPLLLLGYYGNAMLVWATIKHKQLHHRNGILVGIIAFLDFIHVVHETVDAIKIFLGAAKMTRRQCFYSIIVYCFTGNFYHAVIIFLALDRLIAVWFPLRYRMIKMFKFIGLSLTIGAVYASPYVIFNAVLVDNELVEPCNPPLAFQPVISSIWSTGEVTCTLIVLALNVVTVCRLHIRKHVNEALRDKDVSYYKRQLRLTNSLIIMMIFYVFGCVLTALILFITKFLPVSNEVKGDISTYVALLSLTNYASHYYILLWRSEEYRNIFLKTVRRGTVVAAVSLRNNCMSNFFVKRIVASGCDQDERYKNH